MPALGLRQRHWETRLVAWADTVLGKPYVWGETDCLSLAATAVREITGTPLPVPSYRSALAARQEVARVLEEHETIGAALQHHGARWIGSAAWAQPGDLLVWEPTAEWPFPEVAVVVGVHIVTADEHRGVVREPLTRVVRDDDASVYRVGA